MAGLDQIVGAGTAGHGDLHGARTVGGRDAGGDALGGLDGNGEIGAVRRAVAGDHQRQVELAAALGGQRQADQATAEPGHEVDGLGRDEIGCQDQVTFVFAVFLIDQDDHPAGADFGNDFFDCGDGHGG